MNNMSPNFQVEIVCNEQMPPKDMTLKQLWLSQWMGKVSRTGRVISRVLFGRVPFFCCSGSPYTGTLAHMVELEND